MAYRLYHTEGFVLSSRGSGEANKIYKILTPDLGLISCSAQGVRHEKSKFRYSLQNLKFVEISLIRGRDYWRVVHAANNSQFFRLYREELAKVFLQQSASMLRRLVRGEGGNELLYTNLWQACSLLEKNEDPNDHSFFKGVECLFALRVLFNLGYQVDPIKLSGFISDNAWNFEVVMQAAQARGEAVPFINNTLEETHL